MENVGNENRIILPLMYLAAPTLQMSGSYNYLLIIYYYTLKPKFCENWSDFTA